MQSAWITLAILTLMAASGPAKTIRFDAHHFQVTAPADWVELEPGILEDLRRKQTGNLEPIAGLRPASPSTSEPSHVIFWRWQGRLSEAYLDRVRTETEALARLGDSAGVTSTVAELDRGQHSFRAFKSVASPGGPPVHWQTTGHLTRTGLVEASCYFNPAQPPQAERCRRVLGSITIDPEHDFTPEPSRPPPAPDGFDQALAALLGVTVTYVLIDVTRRLWRRLRHRPRP